MEYEITNLIKVAFEKRFDNYERAKYISDFLGFSLYSYTKMRLLGVVGEL